VQGPFSTTSVTQPINVEVSSPTASGAPTRPPDANGWYNHPVVIAFHGNAFSGIALCTAATFAGPPTLSGTVNGTCVDNAGKTVSTTSSAFAYDASPPALTVGGYGGDRLIALGWSSAAFAPSLVAKIVRRPGLRRAKSSVLHLGSGTVFQDHRVRNGVRYRYTLTAFDAAGNHTIRSIVVTPGIRLVSPAPRARLTAPPLLVWTAVRRATYYNVKLFRGNTEVLSAWPAGAKLQLGSKWRFDQHRFHLRPGRYRWFVWPGFRQRAAGRYGRMIGSRTFTVAP
jgi:hypothetical protein